MAKKRTYPYLHPHPVFDQILNDITRRQSKQRKIMKTTDDPIKKANAHGRLAELVNDRMLVYNFMRYGVFDRRFKVPADKA